MTPLPHCGHRQCLLDILCVVREEEVRLSDQPFFHSYLILLELDCPHPFGIFLKILPFWNFSSSTEEGQWGSISGGEEVRSSVSFFGEFFTISRLFQDSRFKIRDYWMGKIRWIFGKTPTGLWPPALVLEIYVVLFFWKLVTELLFMAKTARYFLT